MSATIEAPAASRADGAATLLGTGLLYIDGRLREAAGGATYDPHHILDRGKLLDAM